MKHYRIGRTMSGFDNAWRDEFKSRKAAIEEAKKFSLGCLETTSIYACDGKHHVEIMQITPQFSESEEITFIVLKL